MKDAVDETIAPCLPGYAAPFPVHGLCVFVVRDTCACSLRTLSRGVGNPSEFKGDANRPVEKVSWDDCQVFFLKLNGQVQGLGAGLPTDAQWEYACRAGTHGDFAGNRDEIMWYSANSGDTTHPVKRKKPNPFGLYDMHGNVWEWCADRYNQWFDKTQSIDPTGPANAEPGAGRVIRGGSWNNGSWYCRPAQRFGFQQDKPCMGFRIAAASVTPSASAALAVPEEVPAEQFRKRE